MGGRCYDSGRMASRFPSTPPSQPPPFRHLGTGGQQPVRLQLILGLVVGLVLVAVPLYLWRRPEPDASSPPDAGPSDAGIVSSVDGAVPYVPLLDAAAVAPRVKLGPFQTIRCEDPGPGRTPPERCDHIGFFESALARAIEENVLCAPTSKQGVTVSFVLELDFRKKKHKIYHGKSSSLSREQTQSLFRCVRRAMPTPDWASVPHQHSRYVVSVVASYPPSELF
jgi:hypothetical protein